MRDRTIRLQIDVQETPAEHMAELFALNDTLGWFFFQDQPFTEVKIPDIKLEKFEKHPSQRMRAILYRMWEQTKTDQEFEVWYRAKMDQLCEMLKEKLS